MPVPFAYATGDPHFPERANGGAWAGEGEIRGDSVHALGRVVDLCLRDNADLILPGDNFDGPDPEPGALVAVYAHVRRLGDVGRKVYYVLGNHDRGRDWLAPAGAAAVNVSGRVLRLPCGVSVTGLSWVPTPEAFAAAAAGVRRADVGVYHQPWGELLKTGTFSVSQLPDHRLCVCGDVHVRAVLDKPTHPRKVVSSGPLSPQSVAEFDRTAVHAVFYEPDGGVSVKEVPLPGREFRRYDVESAAGAERVMRDLARMKPDRDLPDDLARPMVAVRVGAAVAGFVDAAERLAADRGVVLRLYEPAAALAAAAAGSRTAADLAAAVREWDGPAGPAARELAAALADPDADPDAILRAERGRHARQAAVGRGV